MKRLYLTLAATALLTLTGCGATRINRVLADPARYQNRNVTVDGRVTNAVGAFVAGVYQVDDGTGSIYVLSTRSGTPTKGARVRVSGTVTPGINVLGRSFGTTLREQSHRVRY